MTWSSHPAANAEEGMSPILGNYPVPRGRLVDNDLSYPQQTNPFQLLKKLEGSIDETSLNIDFQ